MPTHRWGVVWGLAVVLVAVTAIGWEGYSRARGHRPTVIDDRDLWCSVLDQVRPDTPREIVLLGTSRMQLDIDTTQLRRRFPDHQVAQLAVDGSDPRPSLKALADDETFRGIVLYDVLFEGVSPAPPAGAQSEYLKYYGLGWHFGQKADRRLRSAWQQSAAIANPYLGLRSVAISLIIQGRWPLPYYIQTHVDRSRTADYSLAQATPQRLRLTKIAPQTWQAEFNKLLRWAGNIEARGGTVFFVHLPTSGQVKAEEDRVFPRDQYWDLCASASRAHLLHWLDLPRLADLSCPDGSHLDGRDTRRFTDALADWLQRQLAGRGRTL